MITKELIEARIVALESERDKAIGQLNAQLGAIENAKWFLSQWEGEVEKSTSSPTVSKKG
jgi:hypothetical protein